MPTTSSSSIFAGITSSKRCAPGLADEEYLLLMEAAAKVIDDDVEIADILRDRQILRHGQERVIRLARVTLIPVDDGKLVFERAVEAAQDRCFAVARTAMQPDQDWIAQVTASDDNGLHGAVDRPALNDGNAIVKRFSGCILERRRRDRREQPPRYEK
jgi:hypothetical protein